MAKPKKIKFKEIQEQLSVYVAEQNVLPHLLFDANDNVPMELRGRWFMFNVMEGFEKRTEQPVVAIAIAETIAGQHLPFAIVHGMKTKKDLRVATTFAGEKRVSDKSIDALLLALKAMMDGDPEKKNPTRH